MKDARESRQFVIVGAGLAGSLMAIYLGRRGHRVEVLERRHDPRGTNTDSSGRSINLGLSERGIRVLRDIGLLDTLLPRMVPMRGRAIHRPNGELVLQPYGTNDSQILHSILRRDLNIALIDKAETSATVHFSFGTRLTGLAKDETVATCIDERDGRQREVKADAVIGADGVFSMVRGEMQRGEPADYRQEFLDWGYKEVTIPPAPDGTARTELQALHVWPGSQGLIVAHPNIDNSLTGSVFLPLLGEHSLVALDSPEAVHSFFDDAFPGARGLMPDLVEEFKTNPVGTMVSIRTSPWHYKGQIVLIGDACHAVYPFYGQGMNAAFEDCAQLDSCLGRHPDDWASAFEEYQRLRKPHTDVLADLSKQNFVELRDRLRSPLHLLMKRLDLLLNRMFPEAWKPLYTMVSHTTMPYAKALERAERQEKIIKSIVAGVLVTTTASALSASHSFLKRGSHVDRLR